MRSINIQNAGHDQILRDLERDDPEVDRTSYQNMLLFPIVGKGGQLEGVIELINKSKPGKDGIEGTRGSLAYLDKSVFFTKDDEHIISVVSKLVSLVFNSSTAFNNQNRFVNSLRQILDFGLAINSADSLFSKVRRAEIELQSLFFSK